MTRPDRKRQESADDSGIAGPCRIDEHATCHGNVDLPGVPGGIPVPLLRCTCSCHHREAVR